MDLLAITAPLQIVDGTAQETRAVPGIIAQPAPAKAARGRERDFLFAHLSLSGPAEETAALGEELTAALARSFFAASGSVTAALRRAVLATNEQLLRHNLSIRRPHEGALTCAVLHGAELYTLQVGEGLAFLGHNFGIERLPVQTPRQPLPLGRSAGLDIRFAYHRLQTGDMMLLADPRLAYLTSAALSPALVDSEIESALEALVEILHDHTARLLLVEFADEVPSTLPVTFQHSRQRPTGSPSAAPAVTRRAAAAPGASAPPAAPPSPPPGQDAGAAPRPSPMTHSAQTLEAVEPDDETGAVEIGLRRAASTSARGLSRATGWLAAMLGQLRRSPAPEAPSISWALPTMIAVIVPIFVAAVVSSVYLQRGSNAQVAGIKEEMMQTMLLAESAGDAGTARGHYESVLLLATEAEQQRPGGDVEVARMRAEAREALDRIDGVTRMTGRLFYAHDEAVELTGITLGTDEGGVAVLDSVGNRVLLYATNDAFELTAEEPVTIAFNGQSVGTEVVGPIVDLLWLPGSAADTRANISLLDRTGVLFSYFPNLGDMRGVRLGNSSNWLEPAAMATYLDRLYILDRGAGQIWKYFSGDGYTQLADDPAIFFSAQIDLGSAVDFDLYSEDGSLVVAYADGRVRYYDTRSGRVQWDENTLLQNGLATPLVAPTAVKLVGRGLNASIFVLDPGSSRLVQLSRGGTVLTQYRVLDGAGDEVLSKASDFDVTDAPMRVFVAAGNRIYVASR